MVAAIWTTIVLLVAALATAMTLGWRRYTAVPLRRAQDIRGTSCYPQVHRGGPGA
jgi:hypothetical protein